MRLTALKPWLTTTLAVVLAATPALAQKKDAKAAPAADPRQVAIDTLVTATDRAMTREAGTTVFAVDVAEKSVTPDETADVPMTFAVDYLKASDKKIYAPFTVTIPGGALGPGAAFHVYVRLAAKGATPPEAPPVLDEKARKEREKQAKKDKKKGKAAQDVAGQAVSGVEYPWEDFYELTATPRGAGGPLAFSRPFSVEAGEYDTYIAITPSGAAPQKVAVYKTTLTVPDYWSDTFQLSSTFLASKVTPLDSVPTGDAQKQKPFVIGNMELTPAIDGKLTPADEVNVFFMVYGAGLGPERKPDILIEWQPYKKGPLGEAKYRSIAPSKLDKDTLPPNFDVAQGHQVVGSLNVPASAFEPGDYRLNIKVTDNTTGKSLTHDVAFSVAGS